MSHHPACPIDKTMAEAIAVQGRHVDPYNWVCICDRLADEYNRGASDQKAEWQSVLSSTNARAAGEALDKAYDQIRAMSYRCVGTGRPKYIRKADALAVIDNLRSLL